LIDAIVTVVIKRKQTERMSGKQTYITSGLSCTVLSEMKGLLGRQQYGLILLFLGDIVVVMHWLAE